MKEAYIKAIADSIRAQAGNLADFIETNPDRAKKDDLYANIFLALTGILGAIIHMDITTHDFIDILCRLFCEDTGLAVLAKIAEWDTKHIRGVI